MALEVEVEPAPELEALVLGSVFLPVAIQGIGEEFRQEGIEFDAQSLGVNVMYKLTTHL